MARNLWRDIVCEGVETLFYPLELGSEYARGSDFERFALWCACYEFFAGNRVADSMRERLEHSLGEPVTDEYIAPENAAKMWQTWCDIFAINREDVANKCDEKCQIIFKKYRLGICDEKLNNVTQEIDLDRLADIGDITECVNGDIAVKMSLNGESFTRPDRYHSECVQQKINNGEKCNISEIDLLKTQCLCDVILSNKCGKLYLYLNVGRTLEVALELAAFLERHKMYPRIYLNVSPYNDPISIAKVCLSSSERVLITPLLYMPEDKTKRELFENFISELAAIYPIGAVRVVDYN